MIEVLPHIHLNESEIEERFIRSPGPGGQKVNKTETAVQLRFDARRSGAISHAHFLRLKALAGRRMTADGVIVITARTFRTQEQNRRDALDRLIGLVRSSAKAPQRRVKTKPSLGQRMKRLDEKRGRSAIKKSRGSIRADD